jgi:hypothetical protein
MLILFVTLFLFRKYSFSPLTLDIYIIRIDVI